MYFLFAVFPNSIHSSSRINSEQTDVEKVTEKARGNVANNHFHNILRIFDVLSNFPFTTNETMCNYYLQT